jgi:hypothetical protein
MMVELSDEFSEELGATLANVISDMSSEIADTDNPGYRRELQARRARLQSIVESLEPAVLVNRASVSVEVPAPSVDED